MFAIAPAASADSAVELAPGLNFVLPEALSLQFVPAGSVSESPVLIGYIEGLPSYFMVADKVVEKQRTSVLWEKLEMEIRGGADRQSFETNDRGVFVTSSRAKVWYRAYRYLVQDVEHKPVYYLIRQGKNSYWVTLTVAEGIETGVVKPIADAILKRAVRSGESYPEGA